MASSTDELDWDSESWDAIKAQSGQIEFDWFARDAQGHIAVLSSFGVGPSPVIVRGSRVLFNALLRRFWDLPESTNSHLEPNHGLKRTYDWEYYARLGLFAYDNARVHGGPPVYRRIAKPEAPIVFAALGLATELSDLVPLLPIALSKNVEIPFEMIPA